MVLNKNSEETADNFKKLAEETSSEVEKRLSKRIQRNLYLIELFVVILTAIIIPAGWFAIKGVINSTIQESTKTIRESEQLTLKNLERAKEKLDTQISFLSVSNKISVSKIQGLSYEDARQILKTLKYLHKNINMLDAQVFTIELRDFALLLIQHGYNKIFDDISELYPDVINNTSAIQLALLVKEGRVILSSPRIETLKTSNSYKEFQHILIDLVKHQYEKKVLPIQLLVEFHVDGNKMGAVTQVLLSSLQTLNAEETAQFLWELFSYTQVKFVKNMQVTPENQRINDIAQQFIKTTKATLIGLADKEGVKNALFKKYDMSGSQASARLGHYLIQWLYQISL